MKKRQRAPGQPRPAGRPPARRILASMLCLVLIAAGIGWVYWSRHRPEDLLHYAKRPRGTVTFNKDIAPLLYTRCAPCHRPGQPAPFRLLTFADARGRARQIANATRNRYMPP